MRLKYQIPLLVCTLVLLACSHQQNHHQTKDEVVEEESVTDNSDTQDKSDDDSDEVGGSESHSNNSVANGTYSATVQYHNPNTDYSATYTLDVEVEDGQVIQIDFPKGGWLDDDHITPADLDASGDAHIEGEDEKTYDVHIDI